MMLPKAETVNSADQEICLINTSLQRGGRRLAGSANRFNGFQLLRETVETVSLALWSPATPLKRGVNERGRLAGLWLGLCALVFLALPELRAATFLNASNLTTARYNHSATLLPGGQVLVAGGASNNVALASTELFEPATGAWSSSGSLANARELHTATYLLNGRVLIAGGSIETVPGNFTPLAGAELYDPATGTWIVANPLSSARYLHTATLLANGKLLVAGGSDGANSRSSAEVYDPATGIWTVTGALTNSRAAHTATLLPDGRVLVVGGYSDNTGLPLSSAELYDPAAGTWTQTGSLTNSRGFHTATLLPNGKVLVTGGNNNGSPLASAEWYDPSTGLWTTVGTLATARDSHKSTLLPNGKVVILGGTNLNVGGYLAGAEVFDPSTLTWTNAGALANARIAHTTTMLPGGRVLVVGGQGTGGNGMASVELFDPASGSFTNTAPSSTARREHTATLLPNGKVLVAAGEGPTGTAIASAELYDATLGTWAATGPLTIARQYHTATLLPTGKVLLAGGYNLSGLLASAELYDWTTGSFTPTGSMTNSRYGHGATLLANGKLLVAGGRGPSGSITGAELYDPATGTWSITGPLATARYLLTLTLLPNGKVLAAGGYDGVNYLSSAELYDSSTGTWTPAIPMTSAHYAHTATLLPNGKVLVVSGFNGSVALAGAELFDPATGTWTATRAPNVARQVHAATLLSNGKVLVVGGWTSSSGALASAELYDPATGTWATTAPLVAARYYHKVALLPNAKVLVTGGWTGSTPLASAELYDAGLGFSATWQPQITTISSPLVSGDNLTLNGSRFRGVSAGSSGTTQDSPTDYPIVQVRSLDNGQTLLLQPAPGTNWSDTAFSSAPVIGLAPGYALATVLVNGIPSSSGMIRMDAGSGVTFPTTHYVDPNSPNPTAPYATWATAAQTIQLALDAAVAGDDVLVTNGIYAAGGRAIYGTMSNRVAVTKPVTVRSLNGAAFTVIQGAQVPGSIFGDGAIRCVYLTNGAALSGFTLAGGATRSAGDSTSEQCGGAVWCESALALISNCVVTGNAAYNFGGGAYSGTFYNCTVSSNSAGGFGGGIYSGALNHCALTYNSAYGGGGSAGAVLNACVLAGNSASEGGGFAGGTLNNCALTGNSADEGGAAIYGILNNCTIAANTARSYGGGVSSATLNNCIVYFNTASRGSPNCYFDPLDNYPPPPPNYCCTTPPPLGGSGNIASDPLFVDLPSGNLHLQANSPCINAGLNALAPSSFDLDGQTRIVGGRVDLGAFEFQMPDNSPPVITAQPLSRTNNAATVATMTVSAEGTPPLGYQWRKGSVSLSDSGNISQSHTPTLTLSNVLAADVGPYSVVVTNSFGSVTSLIATLSVVDPFINAQPASLSASPGQPVVLSVSATGTTPLTYRWRKDGLDLSDGGNLSGATGPALTLLNVQTNDAGGYLAVIANSAGSATSATAVLTVRNVPALFPWETSDIGAVWSDDFNRPALGTNWIILGGANASVLANALRFSETNYDSTRQVYYQPWETCSDAWTLRWTERFESLDAGSTGVGVGLKNFQSQGGNDRGYNALLVGAGSSLGAIQLVRWDGANQVLGAAGPPLSLTAGDVVDCSLTRSGWTMTATASNRANAQVSSASLVFSYGTGLVSPTISRICCYPYGGTVDIDDLSFSINHRKPARFIVIGASTSEGYNASTYQQGCVSVIQSNFTEAVCNDSAGWNATGDSLNVLPEILAHQPDTAILMMRGNDLLYGYPASEWQSNYSNLVSQLQAQGVRVRHCVPSPRTPTDLRPMVNWIYSNYPASDLIDLWTPLLQDASSLMPFYDSGDGVHLNDAGHLLIAQIIVSNLPPTIRVQPQDQTAVAGSTALFSVTATGRALLTYQWRKDGVLIPGATNATLTLTSIAQADAAGYSVLVSNPNGTVPSRNAQLLVLPLPKVLSVQITNASIQITWSSLAGHKYRLQFNSNLSGGIWQDFAPDLTATGPTTTATNPIGSSPGGFYRVVLLP